MKITRETKIGLVALFSIALAIWGINFLKGINVFSPTDKYYAEYSNVKGLIESASVFLNGYKVGNVSRIEFDKDNLSRIIVEISLEQRVAIPLGSSLVIRSSSLISGIRDLDIELGDLAGFHQPGDTLAAAIQVELSDYIDPVRKQVTEAIATIDTLMLSLTDLLEEDTRKDLQAVIANLRTATAGIGESLQPEGSLSRSFRNFDSITANLNRNNDDITRLFRNLAEISDSLNEGDLGMLANRAGQSFTELNILLASLNQGKGTAGQLIANDSLYNGLNRAVASLDSLLVDLKEHPKRYVQVSVFGRKEK